MRLTALIAVLSLSLLACGRGDDNNTLPDATGSGSGNGSSVTIQQVQSDDMAPGTAVALANVVVTATDEFGAKTGDFWVEEMGGGKRSGVHVFKAAAADVMALNVGDVISLKGAIKSEFALTGSNADKSGRTVTELEPASGGAIVITKTGQTATITPDKVDALAIGQMYDSTMSATGGGTAFSNAWEDWEGVLIELDNVSAASAPKGFGAKPYAADAYSFGITGVAKAEGTMTDLNMASITRAVCFSAMTGVVDYFYDYLVLPRSSADFATGGTGCPAAESVCTDGIDNDGNGFTDCADNGCIISDATCRSATTINALDTATDASPTAPTLPAAVGLTGRCVTAVAGNNFYIADSGTAAADGGAFVFGGAPAALAAGNTVDVIGTPSMFKQPSSTAPEPQLEINGLQVTKDVAACTVTPTNPGLTAAQLTADATGHKWIGSLVTITGTGATGQFKVATAQTSTMKFGTLTQNATTFSFGGTFVADLDVAGTCYTSITGIWTYDTTGAGSYEILPTVPLAPVTCQ
ncbi:MAG: hypothetical protein ABI591_16235 [Kofleriaceae bacterium]